MFSCSSTFSRRYLSALSSRLNTTFVMCISSANTVAFFADRSVVSVPPTFFTFMVYVCATSAMRLFKLISRLLYLALLRSNNDICNTFSTWKRSRLVSSLITPESCSNIFPLFATAGSASICAASDIVDIGVLNSCVMLLMKSFFISVYFLWRNTSIIVNMYVASNIIDNMSAGMMNRTLLNMYFPMSGKCSLMTVMFSGGSLGKSILVKECSDPLAS